MKCPFCSAVDDRVVDSRESREGEVIRRRRECTACGRRFTSYETIEEIPYMVTRTSHGWQYVAIFLVLFHFIAPWLLLLSRNLKRTPHRLVIIACWILFVRFADIFMLVSPEFNASGENLHLLAGEHASHFFVHWLDIAAPLAIGGLWLWMFFGELRQRPLLAAGDPYLRESLETAGGGH